MATAKKTTHNREAEAEEGRKAGRRDPAPHDAEKISFSDIPHAVAVVKEAIDDVEDVIDNVTPLIDKVDPALTFKLAQVSAVLKSVAEFLNSI